MAIRDAVPEDFEDVQRLNRQIFEYEFENCEPTSNIEYPFQDAGISFISDIVNAANTHSGLVYEKDGKVVGYVSLRDVAPEFMVHRNNIKLVQLQTLCVDKDYRGQGIGRQLVEAAKIRAKQMGANRLKVVAYAKNDIARIFYKEMGFDEFEIAHELGL